MTSQSDWGEIGVIESLYQTISIIIIGLCF
jgi:hypothetical protein